VSAKPTLGAASSLGVQSDAGDGAALRDGREMLADERIEGLRAATADGLMIEARGASEARGAGQGGGLGVVNSGAHDEGSQSEMLPLP
jgi:hypothetical protein